MRLEGDVFNVRSLVGRDYQGRSAFLFCHIEADRPGEVEFCLSSRLDVRIWLNDHPLDRQRYFYDDLFKGKGTWVHSGHLQAGANRLLLQVSQLGLDRGLALRILPPERVTLAGRVLDSSGQVLSQNVRLSAWQAGRELARIRTDNSGQYHLSFLPNPDQPCDLSITFGEEGCWQLGNILHPGERQTRDFTLHPAISLSGTLSMLDQSQSPHREVSVQALSDGVVVASTLSDDKGNYQFINLKPGRYQVRCQTAAGHRYYLPAKTAASQSNGSFAPTFSPLIEVDGSNSVSGLDFHFTAFKKGSWRHFDTFDGLPSNTILGIVLAPSGELWFQTAMGLGTFDGQRFATIPGTENKPITAITVDREGAIWFGTYTGLYCSRGGSLTFFSVTNGLADNTITALCAARSGEIWIGTEYGLSVYDGRQFRTFTVDDGLIQNDIWTLGQSPDGSIWIGSSSGLSRYHDNNFSRFTVKDGLPGNEITALECSSTDKVRVACNGGIAVFNGTNFSPLLSETEVTPRWVRTMHAGSNGRLWLGTERGVSFFDGQVLVNFHPEEGLGGHNVMSMVATSEGLLWLATDRGVACLDTGVANFTTKDGLADNRIFDLSYRQGSLWYGMEWGGLGRYDGKEFSMLLPNLYARKLHHDTNNVLWLGCNKGALRIVNSRALPNSLLENRWVMAIASDSDGHLWFGDGWSGGGLVQAIPDTSGQFSIHTFTREDGLSDNEVYDILALPGGILWVGTANGVSRFDGRQFTNYGLDHGLPNTVVRAIKQVKDGTLWFGTDGGIARFDGDRFQNISAAYGLAATRIWSIYQARDGLIWFATESRGVCAFDGQAFSFFDSRDGLAQDSVSAIAEDDEGNLWFGTFRGGLTCYRRKTAPPKVQFTQVKTAGKTIPEKGRELHLRIHEPATIGYETLDWLTPPYKRQYRVCLRHLSPGSAPAAKETVSVTPKSEFDWTPSQAGTYSLEVQAIGQNLVYSQPIQMTFSVFVPWYELNRWRIPAGGAVLAVLVSAFWLAYSNHCQRQEARRLKDQMLVQEQASRAALEDKNRQLEQHAAHLKEQHQRLEEALANVKTLRGLVPICSGCKKIRDDNGFWDHLESFVQKHSEAQFSHGMCPDCLKKWYPDYKIES